MVLPGEAPLPGGRLADVLPCDAVDDAPGGDGPDAELAADGGHSHRGLSGFDLLRESTDLFHCTRRELGIPMARPLVGSLLHGLVFCSLSHG